MHAVVAIFKMDKPDGSSRAHLDGIVERVRREDGFVAGYWTHDGERAYNMLAARIDKMN